MFSLVIIVLIVFFLILTRYCLVSCNQVFNLLFTLKVTLLKLNLTIAMLVIHHSRTSRGLLFISACWCNYSSLCIVHTLFLQPALTTVAASHTDWNGLAPIHTHTPNTYILYFSLMNILSLILIKVISIPCSNVLHMEIFHVLYHACWFNLTDNKEHWYWQTNSMINYGQWSKKNVYIHFQHFWSMEVDL